MSSKVTLGKYTVYLVLISIQGFLLTLSFAGFYNFKMNTLLILGIGAGLNVFLYIIYRLKLIRVVMPILSVIFLASVYLFIGKDKFFIYAKKMWKFVYDATQWFMEYIFNDIKINPSYALFILICFVIIAAIVLFLLIVVNRYGILTMLSGIILMAVMWFCGYKGVFEFMQWYVYSSLVLYAFISYDKMELKWRLKKYRYSKITVLPWLMYTSVVVGIAISLTTLFPQDIKPMEVEWSNDSVFSNIFPSQGSGSGGQFDIAEVGFGQESSKLGGSVKTSNRLLFKVKVDGEIDGNVYLRGTIKDTYTGSTWTKSDAAVNQNTNESKIANLLGSTERVKESKETSITIYPEGIRTTSLFNIWMPYEVETPTNSYKYDGDGQINLDKALGKNKYYKVTSKIPIIYSDELKIQVNRNRGNYITRSFGRYLQLPSTIPDRVVSLTKQIISKHNNDFEKAEAIQDYLRSNYPYILETSMVPEDMDFVDYFLFEEKKGYCTYYASAMAVMSRIAGIPSRYVEGFVLTGTYVDENGLYNVTSDKAHAWVELYFDGYGWIRFEPTSSYMPPNYERPILNPGELQVDNSVENTPQNVPKPEDNQKPIVGEENIGGVGGEDKSVPWLVYIIAFGIAAVVIRITFKHYRSISRIKRADRLKSKEAVMEYFAIIEKSLSSCGIRRGLGETPYEYGCRIQESLSAHGIDIKELINSFEKIRFGNEKMDDKTRSKFKNIINNLDGFVRFKKGIFKYLLMKYVL